MTAYVDSSVILRVLLGEPGRLADWKRIDVGVTSTLAEVECLRTLDRLHLAGRISQDHLIARRTVLFTILERLEMVEVTRSVLQRASGSFSMPLTTLDAIHLATALMWKEDRQDSPVMATHDRALGLAAGANGLPVIGI